MPIIILDRDDHYIGVHKEGKYILLAHRHLHRRNEPDSDDVYLKKGDAIFLTRVIEKVLKRKIDYDYFMKDRNRYQGRNAIGYWAKRDDEIKPKGYIDVHLNSSKNELGIHYETSWIGLGIPEAKFLVRRLKDLMG